MVYSFLSRVITRRSGAALRIKMGGGLLPLNLVVIVLIVIITLASSGILRIIFGLPIILLFPGYVLVLALFPKKEGMDGIERVALSFGLSIAVVPIIGLILNFTWWGITLESTLYSTASFIFVMSIIAWVRRKRLQEGERFDFGFQLRLLHWSGSDWGNVLSVVLVITILGAMGTLGYVIATPKVGEEFTEFYILGPEGEATDYSWEFNMGEAQEVVVGIINHEHQEVSYRVEIRAAEALIGELGPVVLEHEQEWEREVSFSPVKSGDNQKVEFLLYKQGQNDVHRSLHLWVNVKE